MKNKIEKICKSLFIWAFGYSPVFERIYEKKEANVIYLKNQKAISYEEEMRMESSDFKRYYIKEMLRELVEKLYNDGLFEVSEKADYSEAGKIIEIKLKVIK
jgi:flagellar biosynthesis protein FliP